VQQRQPVFNAPRAVLIALAVLVAIHAGRMLLDDETDAQLVLSLAFVPARYTTGVETLPGGTLAAVASFVTHALVHGDWVHLVINSAWLLIFGSLMVRRMGAGRVLLLSAASAIAGAAVFLMLNRGLLAPVVGASGAVSGLMGASMRLLFAAMDQGGPWLLREAPELVQPMALGEALADRRVLMTIAMLVLINALMAFGIGGLNEPGGIAWEAHLGGFAAGFLLFGRLDRPRAGTAD
jgi:membrane associated rhomboid family serine protease